MAKSSRTKPTSRRRIQDVVTIEATERIADQFNKGLWQLTFELSPAEDEAEERRRIDVLRETARLSLRGALVLLKEFHPEHYRSLIRATIALGRARLRGETGKFELRAKPHGEVPDEWVVLPEILGVYDAIMKRLRQAWKPPKKAFTTTWFVSKDGQYGEPQKFGTEVRYKTERRRVQAIIEVARTLAPAEVLRYEVAEKKARRWVRASPKRSDIARELLADFFNEVRRRSDHVLEKTGSERLHGSRAQADLTAGKMKNLLARARDQQRMLAKLPMRGVA